ncbi:MAG: hypothetical protein ABIR47_09390 [Candidatus Kapaibacterium sp.]
MRTSDELFHLIKSLTKSEKRYFRLFTSIQQGEKKYLQLFDALEGQEEYDEAAIRKKFSGERFTRQLNVAKKYLYNLILKSLRVYHSDYSAGAQVRELIASADILYSKGLTDQSAKMVEKAIALARTSSALVPLLDTLQRWPRYSPKERPSETTIDAEFNGRYEVLDQIRNLLDYGRLEQKMNMAMGKGHLRSPEEAELLERCVSDPLLLDPANARSPKALIGFHNVLSHYHYGRGNLKESLRFIQQQIEFLDGNPTLLIGNLASYLSALHNSVLINRQLLNLEGYRQAMEKLRSAPRSIMAGSRLINPQDHALVFGAIYTALLCECVLLGRFEEGAALAMEIEEGLRRHGPHIAESRKLVLYSNLVMIFFGLGNIPRALEYVNRILSGPEPDAGKQIYYHARLVNIIIHFELGNLDLIPYLVRSTYRYYRKQNIMYRFESKTLEFLQTLPRIYSNDDLMKLFERFLRELIELSNDPYERDMLRYFYYVEWLESRIARRDFTDVLHSHISGLPFVARFGDMA